MPDTAVVLASVPALAEAFLQVEIGADGLEDAALRRCHSSKVSIGSYRSTERAVLARLVPLDHRAHDLFQAHRNPHRVSLFTGPRPTGARTATATLHRLHCLHA